VALPYNTSNNFFLIRTICHVIWSVRLIRLAGKERGYIIVSMRVFFAVAWTLWWWM